MADRDLQEVARRAVLEYAAWRERNAARTVIRKLLRDGEWQSLEEAIDACADEDVPAIRALAAEGVRAQRAIGRQAREVAHA